jgi:ABC-type sugar transport system permease subunit
MLSFPLHAWRKISRASLAELVVVTFALALLVLISFRSYQHFQMASSWVEKRRDAGMLSLISATQALVRVGEYGFATDLLRKGIVDNHIEYFVIYKNGVQIHAEPAAHKLVLGNTYEDRSKFLEQHILDENRSEISRRVSSESDTVITVGRAQLARASFFKVLVATDLWKKILTNYLMVVGLVGFVVVAHTVEFRRIARDIRKTGRVSFDT